MNKQVQPAHGGTPEYTGLLEKIATDGTCPFCVDFIDCHPKKPLVYHQNPVLINTKHWVATDNIRGYTGVVRQLILVPLRHVSTPEELTHEEWVDFKTIVTKVNEMVARPGGAFFMRYGDTNYTCGSVTHLHAQMVFGESKEVGTPVILAPLGYQKP